MKFEILEAEETTHTCDARREGDWLIFTCASCGYARKQNWKTKEVIVREGDDPFVMHSGFFTPAGLILKNAPFN